MRHPASCHRPAQFSFLACCALIYLALSPRCAAAKDYLTINSQPQGATVELDGVVVGKHRTVSKFRAAIFTVRNRCSESSFAINCT